MIDSLGLMEEEAETFQAKTHQPRFGAIEVDVCGAWSAASCGFVISYMVGRSRSCS